MRDKVIEMLSKQEELDERILGDKAYPREEMKLALFVELGEMFGEYESLYKFWKKHPKDDMTKFVEEAVDVWHFLMSLTLDSYKRLASLKQIEKCAADVIWAIDLGTRLAVEKPDDSLSALVKDIATGGLVSFWHLMGLFQITFTDIYEGYLAKNKINHERQDNNY